MYPYWQVPLSNGSLRLNPNIISTLDGGGPDLPACGLRQIMMHEFAHYFEQADHPVGSRILNGTSGSQQDTWMFTSQFPVGNYRPLMHLWNADVSAFPCGVPALLSFCKHYTGLTVNEYDPWGLSQSLLSTFAAARPATAALGVGGPGNSLTLVASNGVQMYVNQGSGSSWALTNLIQEGTVRQACVATAASSGEMLVAWPYEIEEAIPPHNYVHAADQVRGNQIGAHVIRVARSHNGGVTFDPLEFITPLAGALTRSGVSCAWNPNRNTFVVAWQSGYGDDRVTFAERPAAGAGSWEVLVPTPLLGGIVATSHETPSIYFNPFGTAAEALLLWQHSTDLVTKIAQLSYSGGTYNIGAPADIDGCPGAGCDLRYHRSLPSPASIGGLVHALTSRSSVTVGSTVMHERTRARFNFLYPPLVVNQTASTIQFTPSLWTGLIGYSQIVEDRLFVRNAVLETYVGSTE